MILIRRMRPVLSDATGEMGRQSFTVLSTLQSPNPKLWSKCYPCSPAQFFFHHPQRSEEASLNLGRTKGLSELTSYGLSLIRSMSPIGPAALRWSRVVDRCDTGKKVEIESLEPELRR